MKKLFLPMVALFCSASVMAQDFKPEAGKLTLEANVNLLSGSVNLNNSLNQIKVRYFLSEDLAVRVGFGMAMSTTNNVANTDSSFSEDKMTSWSFAPGIEKHFEGTDRLSPYAGLDIMLGGTSYKGESTDLFSGYTATYEGQTSSGDRSNSMFGVNLVAGTDFYFAKHIYLGYEIGFGFSSTKDKDYTMTVTPTSGTAVTTESGKDEGTKWSGISANVRNGIRFGFVF